MSVSSIENIVLSAVYCAYLTRWRSWYNLAVHGGLMTESSCSILRRLRLGEIYVQRTYATIQVIMRPHLFENTLLNRHFPKYLLFEQYHCIR